MYTPTDGTQVYSDVDITGGTGSGAKANITITAGAVTDVDITRGGTGYTVGDTLSVSAANVGGTGSGFSIEATVIEKRAYVNILGGELFVASASSIDFVEDNTAIQNAIDMINSGNKDSIQVGREILMEEYLTPENFRQDFLENHPDAFKGWEKNYYLPPSLKAGSEPIETPIVPPKATSVPEAAIDDLLQNRNNQQVIKDFNDAFGHLGTSAEEYIRQRTRER